MDPELWECSEPYNSFGDAVKAAGVKPVGPDDFEILLEKANAYERIRESALGTSTILECALLAEPLGWPNVLEWVLSACQAMGRGASFEYHNGMFQEPAITLNDWKEPVLDESRRGYASSVGGYVAVDENGEEVFFATPAECVVSMLGQLKSALEAK